MSVHRVLYCDDDPDIREVIGLSLGLDATLEARGCDSAEQMMAIAAAWRPDLVLLDVMMPNTDGPTALAELRRSPSGAEVPVVFMTARIQKTECDRLIALGAVGIVAKPFDPMALAGMVRRFLPG